MSDNNSQQPSRAPDVFKIGKTEYVRFKETYFYPRPYRTDRTKIYQEKEDPRTGKLAYFHWGSKQFLASYLDFPDYVSLEEQSASTPTTNSNTASTSDPSTPPSTPVTPSTPSTPSIPPATTPTTTQPNTTSVPQQAKEDKASSSSASSSDPNSKTTKPQDLASKSNVTATQQTPTTPETRSKDISFPTQQQPITTTKEQTEQQGKESTIVASNDNTGETSPHKGLKQSDEGLQENRSTVSTESEASKLKKVTIVDDNEKVKKRAATMVNSPTTPTNEPKKSMTTIQDNAGTSSQEDFKDFTSVKKLSFIGRKNLNSKQNYSKKDLARTEFDDQIEDELFVLPGRGEVHVHTAFKSSLFVSPKTKKDRIVILARDFVGAFCLFIAGQDGKSKKNVILNALPLIDFFDINDEKDSKFVLIIDGVELVLQAPTISKERLKVGLELAYNEIESKKEIDLHYYRLASVEFANSYYKPITETTGPAVVKSIIEADPFETVDESIQETTDTFVVSKYEQGLRYLHIVSRNPFERDAALQEALSYIEKNLKKMDKTTLEKCLRILEIIFKNPTTTEKPELRNTFLKLMHDIKQSKKINDETIDETIKLGNLCFKSIEYWRSRAKLKEVPFGEDFQPVSQKLKAKKEVQQEKLMRESIIQKKLPSGVFLGVLFFTRSGEILSDRNDNLPSVKLERLMYHIEAAKRLDHPDWQWLMRQGQHSFSKSILELAPSLSNPQVVMDVFRTEFIRGFNDLHRAINQSTKPSTDLGVLLDKVVTMKGQNILYYLMVKQVEHEKFEVPSGYKWDNAVDFEYRQYQKYENLDDSFVIDKLESHYNGSRWVNNAIDYYRSITSKTYSEGLWMSYFNFKLDPNGSYQLIVEDKCRFMTPSVKVADKYDAKKLKDLLTAGVDSIRSLEGVVTEDTPDYQCDTFEKQMFRSQLQLKKKIGKDSLGQLYKNEVIELSDKTKLIIFIDTDTNFNITNDLYRFLWRDEVSFEALHIGMFYPTLLDQYMSTIRKQLSFDNTIFNDSSTSTDEYLRRKNVTDNSRLKEMIRAEEAISLIRWPYRVISCYLATAQSKQPIVEIISNGRTYAKLIYDHTIGKKKGFKEYKSELFKTQDSQEVEAKKQKYLVMQNMKNNEQEDLERSTCSVYDVEVNIEDVCEVDRLVLGPTKEELLQIMVEEEVQLNIIDHLDRMELKAIKNTLDDVISIIEVTTDLVDYAIFEERLRESKQALQDERIDFVQSLFSGVKVEREQASLFIDMDEATYDHLYRSSIQVFDDLLTQSFTLLSAIEKTQTMIDLAETMYIHDLNVEKQQKVLRSIQKIQDKQIEMNTASNFNKINSHHNILQRATINMDEEKLRIMLEEEERQRSESVEKKMRKFVKRAMGYQSFSLPYGPGDLSIQPKPKPVTMNQPQTKPSTSPSSANTFKKKSQSQTPTTNTLGTNASLINKLIDQSISTSKAKSILAKLRHDPRSSNAAQK
ncbi:hypothetical protein C9374_007928 [Naegleria lovaniensis]|uniref:PH domain-containing protein n=1 Tax=Naegleria lovaniensis TaxID=51637 RepID=A0AA88GKH3_NAELO|nr:uncharacterized protein C9374_007928 [Naegleria lovaniensis]KAG2378780.1 hypothetical protein C9374_007928 [Naegleria lovaniensis]